MGLLRWIGGIVVFFWLLGFLFKVGGSMIHILLIVAAIIFIVDFVSSITRLTCADVKNL
jgi:predicted membrane metal-binding protein